MKKMLAALFAVFMLTSLSSFAAPMLGQGTRQLDVNGSIDDNGEDLALSLNVGAGYFIANMLEIGGTAAGSVVGDFKTLSAGVSGEYNFDIGAIVVPFVGAGLSLAWRDFDGDTDSYFVASGSAGVKYFLVDTVALTAQANLLLATDDVYNGGKDAIDWNLTLGTSFYF